MLGTEVTGSGKCLNFDGWFWWRSGWKLCPTHTVAGMFELYEQLLPTRLYACQKTHTDTTGEVMCRLGDKAPDSVAHVLAGCACNGIDPHTTDVSTPFYS